MVWYDERLGERTKADQNAKSCYKSDMTSIAVYGSFAKGHLYGIVVVVGTDGD